MTAPVTITHKLEIDVMQVNELMPSIELACKYQMQAIVVHPQLMNEAQLGRIQRKGRFKIIVAVDWPKGENFSTHKLRGMTKHTLGADGHEIMLSGGRTEMETLNEAMALSEFIKNNLSPATEVRFVLGTQMRPESEIMQMCRALAKVRTPAYVRTDHHIKVLATKGTAEAHTALASQIREIIPFPLKACGNFITAKSVADCPWAARVAVGLTQAQQIIKDLSRQPEGLREMLTGQ